MTAANVIFATTFEGAAGDDWPEFTWPSGNLSITTPKLDGYRHGYASQVSAPGTTTPWRALCMFYPGRADCKIDAVLKWKRAATSGRDELGVIGRFVNYQNCVIARARSMIGGAPEVRLFTVVGGVEVQIGSTYTGAAASTSVLLAGLTLRLRLEDLADGSTSAKVYAGSTAESNGTLLIDSSFTEGVLRGQSGCGIEIRDQAKGSDVQVSALTCYDFADEWTSSGGPPTYDKSWFVELGTTLYSMEELAALSPPVELMQVTVGYGGNGNTATLRVKSSFVMGGVVFPGQTCRVFCQGLLVFSGWVDDGDATADSKSESQTYVCHDATWASSMVDLIEDDLTGSHHFNVYDVDSDEYDPDRVDMTVGEIVKFLFDRYTEGFEGLRYHGACAASGIAYVQAELDLMTAVADNVSVSGNFLNALEALLKYQYNFKYWVDPADKRWHFYDVTDLATKSLELTSDVVTKLKIKPDRSKSFAAIEWRGAKAQDTDPPTALLSDGSVKPAWTQRQADNWSDRKRNINRWVFTIYGSGTETSGEFAGFVYLLISNDEVTRLELDDDDMRGGVISVNGNDVWVQGNYGGRIYLSATSFASPPVVGQYVVSLNPDEGAIAALSAAGVGRSFIVRPGEVCAGNEYTSEFYKKRLKNRGFCGSATVKGKDNKGVEHKQQYEFRAAMLTQEQFAVFGICDPIVTLSQPVKPPVGYINRFPPPGGSPPSESCSTGNKYPVSQLPDDLDLEVKLSQYDEFAAYVREPAEGYHGPAFSLDATTWDGGGEPYGTDWRVRRKLLIDDSEFRDEVVQGPGIRKVCQALLAIFGQRAYSFDVDVATPWKAHGSLERRSEVDRFFGLNRRLVVSSLRRATGFESDESLPIYRVVYDVPGNRTTISAGTVLAWGGFDAMSIARTIMDRNLLRRNAKMMKEFEDFRNGVIDHVEGRISGVPGASIDACQVQYTNEITKRSKGLNITLVDKDEKIHALSQIDSALQTLLIGPESVHPGAPVPVPGLDGAAAQQAVDGPVLRPRLNPRVYDQGPDGSPNSKAGRYGGWIETDEDQAGKPPMVLMKVGKYAVRSALDADGNYSGGGALQFTELDANGDTTTWTTFETGEDFPDGHVPLSLISHGSLLETMLDRIKELERNLGLLEDSVTEKVVQPGTVTADYPDGAPASLMDVVLALVGSTNMRVLLHTLNDPGGIVIAGPGKPGYANSLAQWRLAMPERVLYEVEAAAPGAGENGGNYSPVLVDGAYNYMSSGTILHKQVHGVDLDADERFAEGGVRATDTGPMGFSNAAGILLSGAGQSGAGTIIDLPAGTRGTIAFRGVLSEPSGSAAGAGLNYAVKVSYSFKASAWSAAADTSTVVALTSDGAGTGTGQFQAPGGAVPPGLRKVEASVVRDPGVGSDTAGGHDAELSGLAVEVAVIEGGIWLRIREGVTVADAVGHNQPGDVNVVTPADVVALTVTKSLPEPVAIWDDVSVELNPPLAIDEHVVPTDATTFTVTKAVSEGAGASDSVALELNP